jgi:transposase
MELEREQTRLLLLFQYKLGLNATKAAEQICEAFGDGICNVRTAQRWYKTFREEGDRITDNPRSGRPQEVNREAVINRVEEEPSMSCRMLADEFACDPMTIWHILQEAGKLVFEFSKSICSRKEMVEVKIRSTRID